MHKMTMPMPIPMSIWLSTPVSMPIQKTGTVSWDNTHTVDSEHMHMRTMVEPDACECEDLIVLLGMLLVVLVRPPSPILLVLFPIASVSSS